MEIGLGDVNRSTRIVSTKEAPVTETRYLVECPGCGYVGPYIGHVEDWDGKTYRFKCCGHRAHLDGNAEGGARTWKVAS